MLRVYIAILLSCLMFAATAWAKETPEQHDFTMYTTPESDGTGFMVEGGIISIEVYKTKREAIEGYEAYWTKIKRFYLKIKNVDAELDNTFNDITVRVFGSVPKTNCGASRATILVQNTEQLTTYRTRLAEFKHDREIYLKKRKEELEKSGELRETHEDFPLNEVCFIKKLGVLEFSIISYEKEINGVGANYRKYAYLDRIKVAMSDLKETMLGIYEKRDEELNPYSEFVIMVPEEDVKIWEEALIRYKKAYAEYHNSEPKPHRILPPE